MNKYILVLGGTGATGSLVIHNLIQKGEKVCAIVRSKEKLISALPGRDDTPPEDVLRIIESTILDMKKEEVEICILSSKAVICCLGHNISIKGIFGSPRKLVKDSIQRLCETYKELRPSAPKKFIVVTQALVNGGRMADALAWSGRVSEHIKSVTGVDVVLASSMAGTIGQIGFIAGVDTTAEVDDVNAALAADATYLGMTVEAGDLLVSGSTDRVIAMQMD